MSLRRATRLLACVLAPAFFFAPLIASAQEWRPTQPVVYTVPAGPGGSLDQAARMIKQIAERLKLIDKPIVIENKPGGAGRIALAPLDQNVGDPHYLSVITYSLLTNKISGQIPVGYEGYTPLAMLFGEYVTVSVRAESPVRDAKDLLEKYKANPAGLTLGVATSIGNHIHVGAVKPLKAGGVDIAKITVVPFKSSQESLVNLLGGHLDVMAATTPNVISQMQAGKIRVLAIASEHRMEGPLASVPTWRELGVNSSYESAQGVLAAKGIPPAAVAFWDKFFRTVAADPEWKQFVRAQQWEDRFRDAAATQKELAQAYNETREVLRELGLAKQ